MREFAAFLLVLLLFIAACVWGPVVARLPVRWLWLIGLGAVGANALAWYWIVRPHQIREDRREKGLCISCGYDPRGNVSDVCPECGAAPEKPDE